ncbi:MAG: DUF1572 domain-containing protein [Saprospiraceae bacterium]|nr:DUF1572 domain-containing protein [Saprospiraceae bacterium]MCB9326844.1 DUF1572 domain-containing protein [Lewinellaceae bacterium]
MKKLTKPLADRFREILLNGHWVTNTNFKEQLSDMTWEKATTKVGSLNTIAALTFHINYYIAGVLNVLEGGSLDIRDKYSFDLPPLTSQKAWEDLLNNMWSNAEKFADKVEQMADDQLFDVFVDEKYGTYQRNLEGMIEHCYYHLGQIVLIRKMLA